MSIEAMKQALEALEIVNREMLTLRDELAERGGRPTQGYHQLLWDSSHKVYMNTAIPTAERLRQAIEQAQKQEPEFTTHVVENAYDWTEWVCPDPDSYLMKCCDCGLVHEVQFKVVRYRSETEREDCDFVDDPNVQAVFRMRRSEQWSSEDMAHRAGGLPMEQAQKQEPVAWLIVHKSTNERFLTTHSNNWDDMDWFKHPLYTSPPPRQWVGLTNEELRKIWYDDSPVEGGTYIDKLRQVETKIKEKNT